MKETPVEKFLGEPIASKKRLWTFGGIIACTMLLVGFGVVLVLTMGCKYNMLINKTIKFVLKLL